MSILGELPFAAQGKQEGGTRLLLGQLEGPRGGRAWFAGTKDRA